MPQLAVETYPSQIFWVLVGFALVYLFVSRIAVPGLQEIVRTRAAHVESILKSAEQLKNEADRLERESQISLENAQLDASAKESRLMSDFREKSLAQKEDFFKRMARESREKSEALTKAADEAFKAVSASTDEIVDQAVRIMSR